MPLWIAPKPLVLASRSEVRRKILAGAGLPVETRPASIDERAIEARSGAHGAADVARVLAGAKAHTIAAERPGRLVLGADQTLTLGERRFTKPADRAAAAEQLQALSGRTHQLHSAVSVVRDGQTLFECSDSAALTMRTLTADFIASYLDTAGSAAMTSVGGYQIEGVGIHLFERIDGDSFTIMGLPLLPLLAFLRGNGFIAG
jgi:septum formation protein